MLTKTYTVQDPYGLHARPAGLIVKEAQRYTAEVTLTNDGTAPKTMSALLTWGDLIGRGMEAFSAKEMESLRQAVLPLIPQTSLRGI